MKVSQIMEMLSWKNQDSIQACGRAQAAKLNDIQVLIQPENYGNKAVWQNCALVLAQKPDGELAPYLPKLLDWLQDINWPGALTILERLKKLSAALLTQPLEQAVHAAETLPWQDGMRWLDYLSELLDNKSLAAGLDINVKKTLEEHYHNWTCWDADQ